MTPHPPQRFGPPPAPLFPPPPRPPPPASLHPQLASLASASGGPLPSTTIPNPYPVDGDIDDPTPFSAPDVAAALNQTIATHLARLGAFDALSTFLAESGTPTPPELSPELLAHLRELHAVLAELAEGRCARALEWVEAQGDDADPDGDLEFALRRQEFVRLVLAGADLGEGPAAAGAGARAATAPRGDAMETDAATAPPPPPRTSEPLPGSLARRKSSLASLPPGRSPTSTSTRAAPSPHAQAALAYGGAHFRALLTPSRAAEVCALLTSPLYLPRVLSSPYAPLFDPAARAAAHRALVGAFSAAFLRTLDLPTESPLTVVTDVGGGGALAKIMKVRAVMKEKRTEWSAVGELPVRPLSLGASGELRLRASSSLRPSPPAHSRLDSAPLPRALAHAGRDPAPAPLPVPLDLCVPRLQGAEHGAEPAHAAPVRARHCPREPAAPREGDAVRSTAVLTPCACFRRLEDELSPRADHRPRRARRTLKCPYCPVVSHMSACVRVHF